MSSNEKKPPLGEIRKSLGGGAIPTAPKTPVREPVMGQGGAGRIAPKPPVSQSPTKKKD